MHKVLLCYEDYAEMAAVEPLLKKCGFDTLGISSEFSLSDSLLTFNPDIVIGQGRAGKVTTLGVGRRLKENPRWGGKVILIFMGGIKPDPQALLKIRMDFALEAPVSITKLIQLLASITDQDSQILIEKLLKTVSQDAIKEQSAGESAKDSSINDKVFIGGDRKSSEQWTVIGSATELDEFNRLMGEGSEQNQSPQTSLSTNDNVNSAYLADELKKAAISAAEKAKKYANKKFPEDAATQKQLKRVDAKKAQKSLKSNWLDSELKSQDELRRQFTSELFKKKN